ncbi:Polysaccharide biosynthesis protein [Desulfonema limicola]|uniref:Polysaccharide biosynthesis protein n=1 Tax=Desulfonema limicola TaxID=45656 RepID=A0A975B5K9_9BACT|nr:oligosaccharide flippase family protein [Desulfonema limicola]QTA79204.1 Polysaccharide biosynthesis protein [Desulfonema limicola]
MNVKSAVMYILPPFFRQYAARIESSPLGYRLAKGAFWSLSGALISRGLGLLASILVARILGKTGFGELGIIQSTVGMFGVFAGFGMGLTATKHVAEFRYKNPEKAGRIIILSALLTVIFSGIMALLLFFLHLGWRFIL